MRRGDAGPGGAAGGKRNGAVNSSGPCWVYVIECADGSLYTGSSRDPEERFRHHASGGRYAAKYMRMKKPLRILGRKEFPDRSAALKGESLVKGLSPWEKRVWAHAEGSGPAPGPRPRGDRRPARAKRKGPRRGPDPSNAPE